MKDYRSSFHRNLSPFIQGALVLSGMLLAFAIVGMVSEGGSTAWEIALSLLLFFAILNAMFALASKGQKWYWLQSVITYVALAGTGILMATWITGNNINEAGSVRWLYGLFSFCYLLIISIIRSIKTIVEMAVMKNEELNKK